jgi:hypothetical protein
MSARHRSKSRSKSIGSHCEGSRSNCGKLPPYYVPRPWRLGPTTFVEWQIIRNAALDALYGHDFPECLIEAVRHFQWNSGVSWTAKDGSPIKSTENANIYPAVEGKPKEQGLSDLRQAMQRIAALSNSSHQTVDEALAKYLRKHLATIRGSRAPHVRQRRLLPRSVIASLVYDMVAVRAANGQPPGPHLQSLLKELLDADRPKLNSTRAFVAPLSASWIVAQDGQIGTRELARLVEASPTAVSNWRSNPEFKKEVEAHRQYIRRAKAENKWPPPAS